MEMNILQFFIGMTLSWWLGEGAKRSAADGGLVAIVVGVIFACIF